MMRKIFLWVAGLFALLPVSPWVAAPAGALEWMHINVVDSTTVVPGGDGGTFDGLGRTGLDSGMVYFRGVGAGKFGFYAANYLGPTEVVALYDKTTPVPGGGGTTFFQFPGDPPTDPSPLSRAPVSPLLPVPDMAQGAPWAFEIPIRHLSLIG